MLWQVISAVIDGVTSGATLFLVAVGLSLIFGVLKVLNAAHGSFYAVGAFSAAWGWALISRAGLSGYTIYPAMFVCAVIVGVALGPILEQVLLRWTFETEPASRRENIQLLATFAAFLILEDGQKLVFGTSPYYSGGALGLLGSTRIGGLLHTNYQLLLVPLAGVVLAALRLFLRRSRTGRWMIAVAEDAEIASAMGIRVRPIQMVSFTLGGILAALGGALASPTIGVSIGIGADMMVLSFAVVAIAGLGQIEGAVVASLIIGIAHSLAVFFIPVLSTVAPFLMMLIVLLIRPAGIFGTAGPRRI
jgi:branched-chain amino acid transport system permease protein